MKVTVAEFLATSFKIYLTDNGFRNKRVNITVTQQIELIIIFFYV